MAGIIFEKSHLFYSPNKVIFGPHAVKALGTEVKALAAKKALIITDPGVVKAGLLTPVVESLESSKIPYSVYDQVQPEPPARCVDEAVGKFRSEGCDLVVGLGGGSSLDVAKGASILATNGGSVLDLVGFDLAKKRGVAKIVIPTTAGTGSEVTRAIAITDERDQMKRIVYSFYLLAEVAIVDPLLTLTMPAKVTADSGVDALVHAIETYVSTNASPFSDILAEKAIRWIAEYLPIAWSKGSNLEARYYMSLAATVSGMAFASGGLGAVHALSYPLGIEFHLPHGRANAVMLPHVMKHNLPASPQKYAAVAAYLGKDTEGLPITEAADLAVEAVEELLGTLRIPYRLGDYGILEKDLPKLVEGGMKSPWLFVTNPRDLKEEDVRSIYQGAF